MWKPLNPFEIVSVGDTIRFADKYPGNTEDSYKVVKSDAHYFQVQPEGALDSMMSKFVKYFEVGTYFNVEVWMKS
ncbi:MAG: hypothetical protein ACM3VS_16450 [Candidatus Dadabacteria bacterium]